MQTQPKEEKTTTNLFSSQEGTTVEQQSKEEEKKEEKTPKAYVRLKELSRIKKREDDMDLNRVYRRYLNKKLLKKRTPGESANIAILSGLSLATSSPEKSKAVSPRGETPLLGPSKLETAASSSIYRDDFHFQSRLGKLSLSHVENEMQPNSFLDTITMSRKIDQEDQRIKAEKAQAYLAREAEQKRREREEANRKPPPTKLFSPLDLKESLLKQEKIRRKMARVGRPQEDEMGNTFYIDSVVSSAYNSQKELDWADYRQPVLAPKNSEIEFHQEFQLLGSDGELSTASQDGLPDLTHILSRSVSPSIDPDSKRIFSSQSIRSKAKTPKQIQEEEKLQKLKRQTSAALKANEIKENVIQLHEGFRYDLIPFRKFREIKLLSGCRAELRGPVPIQHLEQLFDRFCEQQEAIPVKIINQIRHDLTQLKLPRYSIQPPIVRAFTNILPMMRSLQVIELAENNLSDKGSAMFLQAIYQLTSVQKLSFNRNVVGKQFITTLEACMPAKPNMIVDLDLSDNKGMNKIVTRLCQLICNNLFIQRLNLAGMVLDFRSARNISKLIEKSEALYDINLRDCGLRGQRMKMIIDALGKNLHLTYFNVSWNSLYFPDNQVSISLAQTIQLHACLIHLDLSSTQLGRQEIFFLMQEVHDAPQIASIHLSHNFLDPRDRLLLRGLLGATARHPRRNENFLTAEARTNSEKIRLFRLRFIHELNKRNLQSMGSQASQNDLLKKVLDPKDKKQDDFDPTREGVSQGQGSIPRRTTVALGSIREEREPKKSTDRSKLLSASSIHRVKERGEEEASQPPPSSGGDTFNPNQKLSGTMFPDLKRNTVENMEAVKAMRRESQRTMPTAHRSTMRTLGARRAKFQIQNLTFEEYPFESLTGNQSQFHSFHEFSFYGEGGGGVLPMPLAHRSDETTSTQKVLQAMPYHNRVQAIRQRKQEEIQEIIRYRGQLKALMAERNAHTLDFNFLDEININQKLNQLYKSDLPMAGAKGELIFSRILGHDDVPGAADWVDSNECWICDKWGKQTVQFDLRRIAFNELMPASQIKPPEPVPAPGDAKGKLPPIPGDKPQPPPSLAPTAGSHLLTTAPPANTTPLASAQPKAPGEEKKQGEGDQKVFALTPIELKKPMFDAPPKIMSPFSLPTLDKRHERHDSLRLALKRQKVEKYLADNKPVPKTKHIVGVLQEAEDLQSRRIQMLKLAHPQIMPVMFQADHIHDLIVDPKVTQDLPEIISNCYDKPVHVETVVRDEDLLPFSEGSSDFDSSALNSIIPKKKVRKQRKKQYDYRKMVARQAFQLSSLDEPAPLLSRDEITMFSSFNNWQPVKMKPKPEIAEQYEVTFFMPPGDHLLYFVKNDTHFMLSADLEVVQYKQSAILMNKIHVVARNAPIEANKTLVRKKVIVVKKFNKAKSVFARWKADTEDMLNKMVDYDVGYSKISRFVKGNEQEIENIKKVFKKDFAKIKNIFLYYASVSTYPRISWNDFTLFVNKCHIVDRNLNLATVDRLFIATNTNAGAQSGMKNEQGLCRFDFLEILVRLSGAKFRDPGIVPTISEALDKLIQENVFPNADEIDWQRFREEELYNTECHLLFHKNETELKKVFNHFTHGQKKQLNGKDVIELINNKTKLNVPDKSIMLSYGSSKMSCINLAESYEQQRKMLYVEFIEFLGRVAKEKYGESLRKMEAGDEPKFSPREEEEEEEMPGEELYWKLDTLLTKIFKAFTKKMKFSYLKKLAKERGEAPDSPDESPSPDTGRDGSPEEEEEEEEE